jgi:hypothetical protein
VTRAGREVYIAGVGLTKVDLTGKVFGSVFDLFRTAYEHALEDSSIRDCDAVQVGIMDSEEFENRANIAAKIADRLVDGRRRVPRGLLQDPCGGGRPRAGRRR